MPAPGPAPLARLHETAMQLGIIVVDAVDNDGPVLDDDTAAFVACGVCIALSPGLDDDSLRADVLAMALALTYTMDPGTTGHAGDIAAAGGFVLISRTREAEPVSALGSLATVIAREHGRDTASAAFEYSVPVFDLARRPAESALLGYNWRAALRLLAEERVAPPARHPQHGNRPGRAVTWSLNPGHMGHQSAVPATARK